MEGRERLSLSSDTVFTCTAGGMVLGELQEAVGVLRSIRAHGNSLMIKLDLVEVMVDFDSRSELELVKHRLEKHTRKKVGILRDSGPATRIHIRVIGKNSLRTAPRDQ